MNEGISSLSPTPNDASSKQPTGDEEVSTINSAAATQQLARERDDALAECQALREKLATLESKMLEQEEANAELKRARQALTEEIFELTKALFEEANGMVASEARARAHIEAARRKLEGELEATKEQLRLEKQQLYELRGKFSNGTPGAHELAEGNGGIGGGLSFEKDQVVTLLERHKHHYFPILLPQLRFESRQRRDGPAAGIWDEITQKLAESELTEFSRFVERSCSLDADGILVHPYMKRICETDVGPCLHFEFKPKPFVRRVAMAMLMNTCCIERVRRSEPAEGGHSRMSSGASNTSAVDLQMAALSLSGFAEGTSTDSRSPNGEYHSQRLRGFVSQFTTSVSSLPESLLANIGNNGHNGGATSPNGQQDPPKFCALCGRSSAESPAPLKYRMRVHDTEPWLLIDGPCRQRLVAAGHFFTFIRHVRGGLYAHRPMIDLYCDLLQFRRFMFYARASPGAMHFFLQSDYEAYLDLIETDLKIRRASNLRVEEADQERKSNVRVEEADQEGKSDVRSGPDLWKAGVPQQEGQSDLTEGSKGAADKA